MTASLLVLNSHLWWWWPLVFRHHAKGHRCPSLINAWNLNCSLSWPAAAVSTMTITPSCVCFVHYFSKVIVTFGQSFQNHLRAPCYGNLIKINQQQHQLTFAQMTFPFPPRSLACLLAHTGSLAFWLFNCTLILSHTVWVRCVCVCLLVCTIDCGRQSVDYHRLYRER